MAAPQVSSEVNPARQQWLAMLQKIAAPVLAALAQRKLKATMPIECAPGVPAERRASVTHLEALGRTLVGLSPWLEVAAEGAEEAQRAQFANLAREAIDAATDPASPDFLNFDREPQPLVDSAFLAQAVLRAPRELWGKLDARVRRQLLDALRATRVIRPYESNWLLFSATIEAMLCAVGESWQAETIDYAIRRHEEWYKGDGAYGDGPNFHWDYYNSFVIQPMQLEVLDVVGGHRDTWAAVQASAQQRAVRFAAVQERLIGPDGAIPPLGRSLPYRFGALQLLALMALRRQLPAEVSPAQVRCAMTAALHRLMDAPGTFDDAGFLRLGFCGHQPNVAETYISTGSLYLCTAGFLPLGLPAADAFWADPAADWTSRLAYAGQAFPIDHAISG